MPRGAPRSVKIEFIDFIKFLSLYSCHEILNYCCVGRFQVTSRENVVRTFRSANSASGPPTVQLKLRTTIIAGLDMDEDEGLARAKRVCWRLLARRDHGEEELARKLAQKDFPGEIVAETIAYFRDLGYLNDRRFAAALARRLATERGFGDRRLRFSLLERGIAADLAGEAVAAVRQEWSEARAAASLIKKKTKNRPLGDDPKEKQRLFRRLMDKGFPPALIYEQINRAEEEDGHDDDGK